MSFSIAGMGTAVPSHGISQRDAAELAKQWSCDSSHHERVLPALYRTSGVENRYSVLLDSSNGNLANRQSFYPPAVGNEDHGPSTAERMQRYEAEAAPLAVQAPANSPPDR